MKKLHWLFLVMCLALMPALQSCDDSDGRSIGDFTPPLWATWRVSEGAFYLDCDAWGTLWPVNTNWGWYEPVDGQRVITMFSPLSENYGGYDYAVELLRINDVLTKEVETLTPENDEKFGNDPVSIYQGDISISGGYLNVIFQQNLPSKLKHLISLVRAQEDAEVYTEEGYIHLELRYNDYNDLTGVRRPGGVSYNLNSLNINSETKGIKLKLNSEVNQEVELTFNFKSSPKTLGEMKDLDFSEMKLK